MKNKPVNIPADFLAQAKEIVQLEASAISGLIPQLTEDFNEIIQLVLHCKGKLIVTGMGKSGLIGRKIVATFSSTGTPSFFLHPSEAFHGDLGMIGKEEPCFGYFKVRRNNRAVAIDSFFQEK